MPPPSQRPASPNANHGSVTLTTTQPGPSVPFSYTSGTLRLRAASDAATTDPATATANPRRIQWADDVVDNEGMGKKSSKVCCIYHKPRDAGESSNESSSDSDSDSDSEPDTSRAQPANSSSRPSHRHAHQHDHSHEECDHHQPDSNSNSTKHGKKPERKRSPNAYERIPKKKTPKPSK